MKLVDRFIRAHNLQRGDAVVINKSFFGTSDPYALYLGKVAEPNETPLFLIRHNSKTRLLSRNEVHQLFQNSTPRRINRLIGSADHRKRLVKHVLESPNSDAFSLILNNCEDYAGYHRSKRRKSGIGIGTIIGVAALVALGALLLKGSDDDE